MSLEAIDMVMKAELDGMSRRTAAEQEARNLTLNAERVGQAMLSRLREEMETQRKELLQQAETRAAQQAEKIHAEAEQSARQLQTEAQARLAAAADEIVGRIVK